MLGKVFQRCVEKSPISVRVRGTLERVLGAEQLDAWYARTAHKHYTRALVFSTVYALLSQVVFRITPSVHAASRAHEDTVGTLIVSVYNKLNGVETHTSAALVRHSATVLAPLIAQVGGACAPWVAGSRVKMIDGNCIEASERRLKALRTVQAGALPGKAWVVFAPAQGLVTDVFPCEDGHAQERSLFGVGLETVEAGELWIADRHFCTCGFLWGMDRRGAFFIARQHEGFPYESCGPWRSAGRVETGRLAEQPIRVWDAQGTPQVFRRLRVTLDQPTRDGDSLLSIVTNLPRRTVSTTRVARLYRKRWTLETALQPLEASFHAEINTLGYPKAALCGFCVALVASNMLAVVLAALRSVHGAETVAQQVSSYSIAHELAETYRGMMLAIPEDAWRVFRTMRTAAMVATRLELARKVRLRTIRKTPRGPKKPRPKREENPKRSHVSTARLLMEQKAYFVTP